jgi:Tfp pilus assembly protein PilX
VEIKIKNNGSVLLIAVFAIALMSVLTIGMFEIYTEEVQLMQNQVNAAQALATAEAGLNDAFSRIRQGNDPNIASTPFNGGTYSVTAGPSTISNLLITSTGTTSLGFVANVEADITKGSGSPCVIRVDSLRINGQ